MTRVRTMCLRVFLLTLFAGQTLACEIDVSTDKPRYRVGDIAIIKVVVKQQHKSCRKDAIEPIVNVADKDLEVVAKTKFKKQGGDGDVWTISYKAKVRSTKASFSASRECPDGGSSKSIVIEADPG